MDMDDDSDDSSSPIETLDQFREKWQKELTTTKRNQKQSTTPAIDPTGRKDVNTRKLSSFPEQLTESTPSVNFNFDLLLTFPPD